MKQIKPNSDLCPNCGCPVPPKKVPRLDDVQGNEHVKRAVEVALSGHHTITLISRGMWKDAMHYAQFCLLQNNPVYLITACPCGNFGVPTAECTCKRTEINRHRRSKFNRLAYENGDIFVEIVHTDQYKQLSNRKPESDELVWERVNAARKFLTQWNPNTLHSDADKLLRTAIQQLTLQQADTQAIQRVARTIAAMQYAHSTTKSEVYVIQAAHVAEAIQYRPRKDDFSLV